MSWLPRRRWRTRDALVADRHTRESARRGNRRLRPAYACLVGRSRGARRHERRVLDRRARRIRVSPPPSATRRRAGRSTRSSVKRARVELLGRLRLTPRGGEEADRVHRRWREQAADTALGERLPSLTHAWLPGAAAGRPRPAAARPPSGAGRRAPRGRSRGRRDLLEAGLQGRARPFRADARAVGVAASAVRERYTAGLAHRTGADGDLAATAQRVAELRNAAGSGHGRATAPELETARALNCRQSNKRRQRTALPSTGASSTDTGADTGQPLIDKVTPDATASQLRPPAPGSGGRATDAAQQRQSLQPERCGTTHALR